MNDVTDLPGLSISTLAPKYLTVSSALTVSRNCLLQLLLKHNKQASSIVCPPPPPSAMYAEEICLMKASLGLRAYT